MADDSVLAAHGFAGIEREPFGQPALDIARQSPAAVGVAFDRWRVVDEVVVLGRREHETPVVAESCAHPSLVVFTRRFAGRPTERREPVEVELFGVPVDVLQRGDQSCGAVGRGGAVEAHPDLRAVVGPVPHRRERVRPVDGVEVDDAGPEKLVPVQLDHLVGGVRLGRRRLGAAGGRRASFVGFGLGPTRRATAGEQGAPACQRGQEGTSAHTQWLNR